MHANIDYECLEKCYRSIDELMKSCSGNEKANNEKMLTDAVGLVLDAGKLAAKEGLLALEEYCNTLPDQAPVGYFKKMLNNCIDGAEPLLLKGFAMNRFCASRLDGYMGLAYLIYLEGVLEIQAGVHPNVIAMGLETMLAKQASLIIKDYMQINGLDCDTEWHSVVDEKEKLYSSGCVKLEPECEKSIIPQVGYEDIKVGLSKDQKGYLQFKLLSFIMSLLGYDNHIQRVLIDAEEELIHFYPYIDDITKENIENPCVI